jgi:hypothetical protein
MLDVRQVRSSDAECDKSPVSVRLRCLDFPKILQYLMRGGAAKNL